MSEELIETLRTFEKNRVEQLEEPAKTLFYAIMEIADERDRLNNIIGEAIEYIEERYNGEVLTHTFDKCNVGELLEILDKGE